MLNPRDIGSQITNALAAIGGQITAAGAGDNTEVVGSTIDLRPAGSLADIASLEVSVVWRAVLAAAATLSLAVEMEESDASDMSSPTTTALQAATVVSTGGGGGSTETGIVNFEIDAFALKRYVRFNYTPNLSAAGTDVAVLAAIVSQRKMQR